MVLILDVGFCQSSVFMAKLWFSFLAHLIQRLDLEKKIDFDIV